MIEGLAYRLRLVNFSDIEFILELRTDSKLSKYIHTTDKSHAKQKDWMNKYYTRNSDYYFVVENKYNSKPEGLLSLYNIESKCGEFGRWIIKPGSFAATESAFLLYKFAFDTLGLARVECKTIADNASVVKFHSRYCTKTSNNISLDFEGNNVPAVLQTIESSDWKQNKERKFLENCLKIAKRVSREPC
jgi:RimJ/RimL family protein N-acetyltransferase